MINIFYVEVKNEEGEYEPLGVMKLEEALAWCWEHDHCTMRTLFLGDGITPQ